MSKPDHLRPKRRPTIAIVAALLAAIAVGCGGGGEDPAATGAHESSVQPAEIFTVPWLTKQKVVAHANDLCRQRWRFVRNSVRQTRVLWARQHPQVSAHDNYLRSVRLSYFAAINFLIFNEIRRFGSPPGQEQAIGEVIGAVHEASVQGEQGKPITSVAQLKALFAEYNRVARRYGLEECLVAGAHLPHPET
jgi:hypothetical protein